LELEVRDEPRHTRSGCQHSSFSAHIRAWQDEHSVSFLAPPTRELRVVSRQTGWGGLSRDLESERAEPRSNTLGDGFPSWFEHHVVAHVGENFCFRTVRPCGRMNFLGSKAAVTRRTDD